MAHSFRFESNAMTYAHTAAYLSPRCFNTSVEQGRARPRDVGMLRGSRDVKGVNILRRGMLRNRTSGIYGKIKMPLFEELRKTSREKIESESDSNLSRDVFLNSSKSGMFIFFCNWNHPCDPSCQDGAPSRQDGCPPGAVSPFESFRTMGDHAIPPHKATTQTQYFLREGLKSFENH